MNDACEKTMHRENGDGGSSECNWEELPLFLSTIILSDLDTIKRIRCGIKTFTVEAGGRGWGVEVIKSFYLLLEYTKLS
jgi:hypothetical protein